MYNEFWARIGRDDQWLKLSHIQNLSFTRKLEGIGNFTIQTDFGRVEDFIQMGMITEIYNYKERLFKGKITSYTESDEGVVISGPDMMYIFPNIYVDLYYSSSTNVKDLVKDLLDDNSSKKHVDGLDAVTYVANTDLSGKWLRTDTQLSTVLKDLITSSQDPQSVRRNTYWLDPYDYFHVHPFGWGEKYTGKFDVIKQSIGAEIDGTFCNYAVVRGARANTYPANQDAWTEGNASSWTAGSDTDIADSSDSIVNQKSIRLRSTAATVPSVDMTFSISSNYRDFSRADYAGFWLKWSLSTGSPSAGLTGVKMFDSSSTEALTAFCNNAIEGDTTPANNTWIRYRIPLSVSGSGGDTTDIATIEFLVSYYTAATNQYAYVDGLYIEQSEVISTKKDLNSILTFGLFEKRKQDRKLFNQADADALAQSLLKPYPKLKYNLSVRGYAGIDLNQTIEFNWMNNTWTLPLTEKRFILNSGIARTDLRFGGLPVSMNDIMLALAIESRAEAYGKTIKGRAAFAAGDDPENHRTIEYEYNTPDIKDTDFFSNPDIPISGYKSKSAMTIANAADGYYDWGDYEPT